MTPDEIAKKHAAFWSDDPERGAVEAAIREALSDYEAQWALAKATAPSLWAAMQTSAEKLAKAGKDA